MDDDVFQHLVRTYSFNHPIMRRFHVRGRLSSIDEAPFSQRLSDGNACIKKGVAHYGRRGSCFCYALHAHVVRHILFIFFSLTRAPNKAAALFSLPRPPQSSTEIGAVTRMAERECQ